MEEKEGLIFIVDESKLMLKLIKDILGKENYNIITFKEPSSAFREIFRQIPDVAITDLLISKVDIFKILKILKSNTKTKNTAVIVLTLPAYKEKAIEALKCGASDYILKPFDPTELRVKVKNQITIVKQIKRLKKLTNKIIELYQKVEDLSLTDALTQITNRRGGFMEWEKIHNISKRWKKGYSLGIIDIDNFKKYNDTYGHKSGDNVLKSVASQIKKVISKDDVLFRYGGEEFITILTESDKTIKTAKEILNAVRELKIPHEKNPPSNIVTVSMGFSICNHNPTKSKEIIFKEADKALYIAKSSGKDRFFIYEEKNKD